MRMVGLALSALLFASLYFSAPNQVDQQIASAIFGAGSSDCGSKTGSNNCLGYGGCNTTLTTIAAGVGGSKAHATSQLRCGLGMGACDKQYPKVIGCND